MSDFDEIEQLAAELSSATPRALRNAEKALEVTAGHVKSAWRRNAAVGHRGIKNAAPAYQYAIDYEVRVNEAFGGASVEAEIGPELRRTKGAGMGFLEAGGGGVRSAPQHAGRDALYESQEDFVRGMAIVAVEAVLRDGS